MAKKKLYPLYKVRKQNVLLQHVEHYPFQNRWCHKPFKILLMSNLPWECSNTISCVFDLCHCSSYIVHFILTKQLISGGQCTTIMSHKWLMEKDKVGRLLSYSRICSVQKRQQKNFARTIYNVLLLLSEAGLLREPKSIFDSLVLSFNSSSLLAFISQLNVT